MIVKLSTGKEIPVEMHKMKIVQKTRLVPVDGRLKAIEEGGYNTLAPTTERLRINLSAG